MHVRTMTTWNKGSGYMGMFDFVKDAGEKLFGRDKEAEKTLSDAEKATALQAYVTKLGLPVQHMVVAFKNGTAEVHGLAANQADKEKAILAVGNAAGVERVDDRIRVEKPEPEATFYTVKSGDSLSKIAKAHYGDAAKYPAIFEANKPLLKDPDKIYPGQVLRIPAK
jgi:nucleoid-associated protein YgaU